MDATIINFLNDYLTKSFDDLELRYWRKLPQNITIKETVECIKYNKLTNRFIDTQYYGDIRDKRTVFLLKIDEKNYEAFISDRGNKHWLRNYNHLDDALFSLVDIIFNDFGHAAPDSLINAR